MLCPSLARAANFVVALPVPGRFLASSLKVRDKTLVACSVRNYGLGVSNIINDFLFMLSSNIELQPTLMLGFLIGAIRIKAEHEKASRIGRNFVVGLRDRVFDNPLFTCHRLGSGDLFCPRDLDRDLPA